MLTLYQFPISHYCEKIRWALDYKGLDYRLNNQVPGFHLAPIKKLTGNDTVLPILRHDERLIQGSDRIIDYLDQQFPDKPLTPSDPAEGQQALEWERYLDQYVGPQIRLCFYHILLEHPKLVIPLFTHRAPWHKKLLMRMVYPTLRRKMRAFMKINAKEAARSKAELHAAVDRLDEHLQKRPFLVGDRFSRADLAAASLLAAFVEPEQYGLPWPQQKPPELVALIAEFRDKVAWVERVYREYR